MIFWRKPTNSTGERITPPADGRRSSARSHSRLGAAFSMAVATAAAGTMILGMGYPGAAPARISAQDSADTHAAPAGGPASSKIIGISDPQLTSKSPAVQASQLAAMKAIGITSIRLDADWAYVQPSGPNTYYWAALDQVVRSIRAAGMSADLIIDDCPQWAAVAGTKGDIFPQPASPALFAKWAADVAARYAPLGVSTFEIWNEPNNAIFWNPKPNPAAYTADLVAAYAAIKKVDPSAVVVSGGLAPEATDGSNYSPVDFLKAMYAHGAKGSFDALGYHPYSFPALPDTYELWSAWSQMSQTQSSIRGVMTNNGDSGKSVWITEFGAPSGGPDGVGQAAQATALTQGIADARKTSWIHALYVYSWQDDGTDRTNDEDWYGLLTAGGSAKSGYHAVAVANGK